MGLRSACCHLVREIEKERLAKLGGGEWDKESGRILSRQASERGFLHANPVCMARLEACV